MKRSGYISIGLVLAVASFAAGARWGHRHDGAAPQQQVVASYACPMHPQYRSDRPGDCPSCGMRLEPVQAERGGNPLPSGTLRVTPDRQQIIGVRLGVAEPIAGKRTLRTTGRVAPDENALFPLAAGADGLVRDVRGATTGSFVRKGEVLLTYYAPEFVNTQLAYFSGLDTLGRGSGVDNVERFANTLRNLGVSEQQLERLRKQRKVEQYIEIDSPVNGFVLERKASANLRCSRGFEFYRVADLRRVWIVADVYDNQAPFVRAGSKARVTSQNRRFEATVSRVEPTFDEATRTLKVRLDAVNPGAVLKPGMFVDVDLDVELQPSLAVPSEAIVDSGLRKTVFVDRGEGHFEPRTVETGWRLGDQVEIKKGLMSGERIVISGTFLMDSESRMNAAGHSVVGEITRDPICGMEVEPGRAAAAGRTSQFEGVSYYFCADECKKRFDADPARHAKAK